MNNTLPLKVQNDIEPLRSFEGIKTPHDLAVYMAAILGVDISQLEKLEEIIFSSLEPTGDDRSKIFINTSGAPSIGIPIGGSYKIIYQYPPNVPMIWTQGASTLPSYLRALTSDEMTQYSLTAPVNTNAFWFIFNP